MLDDLIVAQERGRVRVLSSLGPEDPGELIDRPYPRTNNRNAITDLKESRSIYRDYADNKRAGKITSRCSRLRRSRPEMLLGVENDSCYDIARDLNDWQPRLEVILEPLNEESGRLGGPELRELRAPRPITRDGYENFAVLRAHNNLACTCVLTGVSALDMRSSHH